MNDIFVAVFIVAAYWSSGRSGRADGPQRVVGAAAGRRPDRTRGRNKWVGFYALAGLWVLVLARSDLGRLLLVALVAFATVVGGIGAPWPFLVSMLLPGRGAGHRPRGRSASTSRQHWSRCRPPASSSARCLAFALAYDQVGVRTPARSSTCSVLLARGGERVAGVADAGVAAAPDRLARLDLCATRDPTRDGGARGRWAASGGHGSALPVRHPADRLRAHLRPLPAARPWWTVAGGPGYGWSIDELHSQMFGYHFGLTAGHASASPWWSWPLASSRPGSSTPATTGSRSRSSTTAATRSCSGPASRPSRPARSWPGSDDRRRSC